MNPYLGIPHTLKVALMRECTYYDQLIFLGEQYDDHNSIRDQDYEVTIQGVIYRGILLNTGHAVVTCSQQVGAPRFFLLEPNHAGR